MSDPTTNDILAQLMIKANELQARTNHLSSLIRKDTGQTLDFEREMVRQSIQAVSFWFAQAETRLPSADDSAEKAK